jgi:hypothetical protein
MVCFKMMSVARICSVEWPGDKWVKTWKQRVNKWPSLHLRHYKSICQKLQGNSIFQPYWAIIKLILLADMRTRLSRIVTRSAHCASQPVLLVVMFSDRGMHYAWQSHLPSRASDLSGPAVTRHRDARVNRRHKNNELKSTAITKVRSS